MSQKYSVDEDLARRIIQCESNMYEGAINYNKNADGTIWSQDLHDFQINDFFHKSRMESLGLNYYDRWDSLEYGFMLLAQDGVRHWKASRYCWSK